MPLEEAVIDAGAVRFRPMMVTADGGSRRRGRDLRSDLPRLAMSLMAGEMRSLLLSRAAVPVLYFSVRARAIT